MGAPPTFTVAQRRARLAVRHRLVPRARPDDDVAAVAASLVGLHSSDPVSVYLSAAARMKEPSLGAVDRALYDDRSIVRHHAMRRTLWVLPPDTAREAHASSTVKLAGVERRRFVQLLEASPFEGDAAAWIDAACAEVLAAVTSRGTTTTRQVGLDLPALALPLHLAPGKPYGGTQSAHVRVLLLLGFEGELVRVRPSGSWINGQYAWTAMAEWVPGGVRGLDVAPASASLAQRWLRAFGPATSADLQWWTGWTGAQTKRALADAGAIAVTMETGDGAVDAWVAAGDDDPAAPEDADPGSWVALLPGLDPTTMGWKDRRWYLDDGVARHVFDRNGNGGPTVWADGRIVGGWVQQPSGTIAVELFESLPARTRKAVVAEAERLEALLGPTRFKVRFPAPMQPDLLAR